MMLYFLFCSLIKCWSFLSSFYGARKVLSLGWRLLTGLPTRARTTSQSTKSSLLNLTKLKRRWETFSLFPFLSSDRCDNCGRQPVGARRGVLPQVDDAAGLGVSGIDLSPFRHHFATILSKFCHHCQLLSLAIVLVNMVNMVCRATGTGRSSWAGPASWRSRSSTMMVCSSSWESNI